MLSVHLGFHLGQERPCFLLTSPEPKPQPRAPSAHVSIGSAQPDCGSLLEFDKKKKKQFPFVGAVIVGKNRQRRNVNGSERANPAERVELRKQQRPFRRSGLAGM